MMRRRAISPGRRMGIPRWTPVACSAALALSAIVSGCAASSSRVAPAAAPDSRPAQAQRVVVNRMEIVGEGDVTRIRLHAGVPPRNRLVTTRDPASAELTLFDVTLEGLPPSTTVEDGTVDRIEVRALAGGEGVVTAKLAGPAQANVSPWKGGIDLVIKRGASAVTEAPAPGAGAGPAPQVRQEAGGVRVVVGAEPSNLGAFVLSDGRRLVVDADGITLPEPQVVREFDSGTLVLARLGNQEGRVRGVFEAREAGAFEGYRLEKRPDGFEILLGRTPRAAALAPMAALAAAAAPETVSGAPSSAPSATGADLPGGGRVVDFGFHQEPDRSLVEIALSKPAPHEVREATGEKVVVDLLKTSLPEAYRRALDTSAFPGPVRLVAAYPRGGDTRIVIDLRTPAPFRLEGDGSKLVLAFEGGSSAAPVKGATAASSSQQDVVVIEGGAAPGSPAEAGASRPKAGVGGKPAAVRRTYTGQRLSLDFMDADIRNVLRLVGEVSGLNIVAGDDVQGKITVRLVDVPWDQALEVILKTRGLDQVREGNVIRIAPVERLAQEKKRAEEAEKASEEKAPLVTDIIPVNYASAQEISDKVKAILTERGTVTVDARTNAILVKDVAEKVAEARQLVARLDTQTPQVLIEARIVEVSSTFAKDLGIQWGGRFTADTAHGNATDWAFPNSIGLSGSTGADNYAVNFPAAVSAGSPGGALAMTLGHVNDILSLDLRLSAIETSGRGRVVSSPRVTTLDNRTAEISQGVEIPFTTATETQIETQSIDYKLKLNVTPHVTSDKSIIMKIDVTKDAPSTTYFAVDSHTPAKETRAATTEVLVKDGETTVIGGIITNTQSNSDAGVPWLSKIPVVGWLFKKKNNSVDKTELIIFITPKIVNVESVARSK